MNLSELLEFISVFRPFFCLLLCLLVLSKFISFLHKHIMCEDDYELKLELSDLPKPKFLQEHLIKVDIERSIKDGTFDAEQAAQVYADFYYSKMGGSEDE